MANRHDSNWHKYYHYTKCNDDCKCCKSKKGILEGSCEFCNLNMPEKHSHEWDKEFHYSSCEKDCRCCKAMHGVSDDSCKICNKYERKSATFPTKHLCTFVPEHFVALFT